MPASQQKPELSPSYKDEIRTLSPKYFAKSRLVVICSRGNDHATVKNLDMIPDSQKPAKQ